MTKENKEFISSVVKHLALTSPEERNELATQLTFTCALYGADTVEESYSILEGGQSLLDEAVVAMKYAQSEKETDGIEVIRETIDHVIS